MVRLSQWPAAFEIERLAIERTGDNRCTTFHFPQQHIATRETGQTMFHMRGHRRCVFRLMNAAPNVDSRSFGASFIPTIEKEVSKSWKA
ncbi:hypothetical protein IMT09_02470 [Burkholderia cepacia]|uniref:hypothetical protein n=1 Tax=Burkholderia TaxID=32008 RepID=UPI0018666884|nr:hypothetical protein [Burkholderia cepacia]MBE2966982.1 hypothetical protein [Burkholderia cepacia]